MHLTTAKPLHIAAAFGYIAIARSLMEHGAAVDGVDERHSMALHFAAAKGHGKVVEALIHSGANVNAVDNHLRSPCMMAASSGFLKPIRALIEGGADLKMQDRKCRTVLYRAAYKGYTNVVLFLITSTEGHTLNAESANGESILYMIARWTKPSCLSFLLNLAPNLSVYEPRKSNILAAVVKANNPAHLKRLLRRLPNKVVPSLLAHRDLGWGTPLYIAATRPAEKVIDMLIRAGAELELEGGEHGTPLMGACAAGRLRVVKALILKGAQTSYTKHGQLFSALLAAKHHFKVIRWLLVGRFMEGPYLIANGKI